MKKILGVLILLIVTYVVPVNACSFTFEDYKKTGEIHSLVVGEYVFDLSNGHSPSLEDFSIAARTIPESQDEYVYEIMYTPSLNIFRQIEVFSNKTSKDPADWPDFFDTTYNYRSNINIENPDYDMFTCKTDNIKISYSLLNTKGEYEYKTEANRLVDIQSTVNLDEAYYCITSDNECKPNQELSVEGKSSSNIVNYQTNELPQHICTEAFDQYGNTSGVVCDNVMVKVDSEPISINATDEFNHVIEGAPHTVDGLFNVKYSVSKGNVYYFYFENNKQYILTNLSDLPSGDVEVKAIGKSGSGLITEEVRTINVRKSIVNYDYQTNGGTSVSKESDQVTYENCADLSVTANKDGYTFVGWNTDANANFALETINITEDTTLYAIYKKVITANFEIYNKQGNIPAVAEYDKTECEIYNNETECEVVVPKISSRVRYEALGWSKEKDDTAEIQGGDKLLVSNNETIYSVTRNLVPNTASFIVLKNGLPSKEVKSCHLYNGDEECSISPDDLTSEDYNGLKFAGFTDSTDKIVEPDNYILTGGKTFYAYYDDTYEINFVSDSSHIDTKRTGVVFIVMEDEVKKVTSEVVAPTPIEKNNYVIIGWRDDLKTEDKIVSVGDRIDAKKNITYYAIYSKEITISYTSDSTSNVPEPKKYKVYYNGGSGTSSKALVTLDSGINMKKSGYVFNGWDCEGKHYDQGIAYSFDTSKTFEAKWTQNATLVVFDYQTNGGTSANVESSTYIHGVSNPIDLSNIIAYKKGYEFIGWSIYPTATSTSLTNYTPKEDEETITLYAIYKKNITVKFENIDESKISILGDTFMKFTIYNNSDGENVTLPNVKSSYQNIEFIGWNRDSKAIEKEYDGGETVKINNNTTLYTIIKNKNPLVSTYIYYDGNVRKTKTSECFLYGVDDSCTTNFGLTGIKYDGGLITSWSTDPTSIVSTAEQTISSNTNFYAVYDRVLTITYLSGMYTDSTPQSRETELVGASYLVNTTGITPFKASIELSTPDGITGFVTEGWRVDDLAEEATYRAKDTVEVIEDTIFYGVYSKTLSLKYVALGATPQLEVQYKTLWYNSGIKNPENKKRFSVADAPIKTGVSFDGWLFENDENKVFQPNDIIEISSNSSMYATWHPNTYTITLDGATNGGIDPVNNKIDKKFEESFELENYNAIPREGYEFVGWAINPDSSEILSEFVIPASDTTLYAVYKKTIKANWIMYDTNAGTADNAFTTCDLYNNEIECNAAVGTITVNNSYQAVGWSKVMGDIEVDAGIGLTVRITNDTDFYSITKKARDLVGTFYYFNNETVTSVPSSCGLYNGATSCDISTPATPANHKSAVFNAWSIANNKYAASSLNIDEDTNYYAYYNQITELKYHDGLYSNGASARTETITKTAEYVANSNGGWANVPTIALKTPSAISGYNTIGWREDTSKTTQSYNINQSVSMNRSYELYAVYKRTITLSYNANGGASTPTTQTATQYYNSASGYTSHTFNLAAAIPRTGYTFKGWRLDSTSGTQYNAGSQINIHKSSVMYAQFNPNNYVVYFNANGGNTPSMANKTVTYDSTYGTLASVSRTGYTFNGWYTSNGSKISSSTTVKITSNQTLYAHWTANTYTINYNLDSGNAGTYRPTSGTYDRVVTISNPTRSGYTFEGWSVTSGLNTSTAKHGTNSSSVTSAISNTSTKVKSMYFINLTTGSSVTLTANWKRQFNLTYDPNYNGIADVGDEIRIGTEYFHVISNNGTTLNALAKYNLNVGSNLAPNATYGIQNELVKGAGLTVTTYGNVVFSNNYGWAMGENIDIRNKPYGAGPIRDALYGANGYEQYLQRTIPDATVRLITINELEALGCSAAQLTCSNAPSWVYATTYWTQSGYPTYEASLWFVASFSGIGDDIYSSYYNCGVRPVVTLSLS